MFGFALKSTLLYILWNKYKEQIITAIISTIIILILLSIYEDINNILLQKQMESSFILVFIKWIMIFGIIIYNVLNFKKTNNIISSDIITEEIEPIIKSKHNNIMNKEVLKSKSDVILKKYLDKK